MRQNLVVVLLSVCLTLLAVNLYVTLRGPQPAAWGQGVGIPTGQVAIATVQGTSNDPWCYVYDVGSQRLAVYTTKNQGVELKGVRNITYDLKLEELNVVGGRSPTVKQVKASLGGTKEKE
jgi:hypothetical protein